MARLPLQSSEKRACCVYFAVHLPSSSSSLPWRSMIKHGGSIAVWLLPWQPLLIFFSFLVLLFSFPRCQTVTPIWYVLLAELKLIQASVTEMAGGREGLLLSIICKNQTLPVKISGGGHEEWVTALVTWHNYPSSDPQHG